MNKKELRKFFRSEIDKISADRKREAKNLLNSRLLELSAENTLIASFASINTEIDLWDFNKEMIKQQKLALPRVSGKDLIFYQVSSMDDLEKSNLGILEPKVKGPALPASAISLFIVPGLAFDLNNNRLGKGKGFYDYFISLHDIKKTVGVGYKEQLSKKPLPTEVHDKALEQILLF